MASFELREPKKKPRYYKLIANVLVNGKIERRYGRFDFDPTELKNAVRVMLLQMLPPLNLSGRNRKRPIEKPATPEKHLQSLRKNT